MLLSLLQKPGRTLFRGKLSRFRIHVGGLWRNAHPSEVESVRVLTSTNGRITMMQLIGMPRTGVVELFKRLIVEFEFDTA